MTQAENVEFKPKDALEWTGRIVNGVGGWKDFERYEMVVSPDRDLSIAYFVVKCLANPKCEGSAWMLEQIQIRRKELSQNGD